MLFLAWLSLLETLNILVSLDVFTVFYLYVYLCVYLSNLLNVKFLKYKILENKFESFNLKVFIKICLKGTKTFIFRRGLVMKHLNVSQNSIRGPNLTFLTFLFSPQATTWCSSTCRATSLPSSTAAPSPRVTSRRSWGASRTGTPARCAPTGR